MEIFPLIFVSYLMTNFIEIKAFYNDTRASPEWIEGLLNACLL